MKQAASKTSRSQTPGFTRRMPEPVESAPEVDVYIPYDDLTDEELFQLEMAGDYAY